MFGDIQSDNEEDFVMPPFSGVVEPIYNESPDQDDVIELDTPFKPEPTIIELEPARP